LTVTRQAWQPLSGVRILDFSVLLPGPFATSILGDLGADIIKVEPLAGDFARNMPEALFRVANRNKRNIALDLKHAKSGSIVARLATWADVAFETFRPGVAARLGIGYPQLAKLNPRIVYCALTGYGQSGPWRDAPGHDLNYLAAAGALMFRGHWLGSPQRSGLPVADIAGGAFAVIAMLAALHERDRSGKGAELDLSLFEAALFSTAARHGLDLETDGRAHLYPTNDVFETADGKRIALGIVEPHFWDNFRDAVLQFEPRLSSADFADEASRRQHGDELSRLISGVFKQQTLAQWIAHFDGRDVPVQPLVTAYAGSASAHAAAREAITEIDGERLMAFPVFAGGQRGAAIRSTTRSAIGADTVDILGELGFSAAEIAEFRDSGAVRAVQA
jgi:crotonobetainyl-CoA:carnitine CoA-transferase CaiB-like acyl-CoA transferase